MRFGTNAIPGRKLCYLCMKLTSTFTQWLTSGHEPADEDGLRRVNSAFESLSTEQRVEHALELLP
jgi:hypothetical protein